MSLARRLATIDRYGYRRIAALLRAEGWPVNHKRIERLWRQEWLKVPQKQPNRRRQHVVDLDIIERSLQDFEGLISLLTLEDQKELMQLHIKEIVVSPYDPDDEKAPSEERAFATQIRTKYYQVNIKLHQIPDLAGIVNRSKQSSDNTANWLPLPDDYRNFFGSDECVELALAI